MYVIIYKDFQASDLNRTWTGAAGNQSYFGDELTSDEQAKFYDRLYERSCFCLFKPANYSKSVSDVLLHGL